MSENEYSYCKRDKQNNNMGRPDKNKREIAAHAPKIPAPYGEMGVETWDSLEAQEPARLAYATNKMASEDEHLKLSLTSTSGHLCALH